MTRDASNKGNIEDAPVTTIMLDRVLKRNLPQAS